MALTVSVVAAPAGRADHTPTPSVVALVGSLQSELGCPNDWAPECPTTRLTPVGGSPGVYSGTFDVPAGSYEYKVALNGSWDENYGSGGAPGGANIPLTATGGPITFTYDHATHVISDDTPKKPASERGAHWLRTDVIAWEAPAGAARYRLHTAPAGGLAIVDGQIAGTSYPLTPAPGGLDADLEAAYPHLAALDAFDVAAAAQDDARSLLTGELVVAAYDAQGGLVGTTGVQVPGILDQLYARATDARLGPSWRRTGPRISVWAPTAKDVDLLLDPSGPGHERMVPMTRAADGTWTARGTGGWRDAAYAFEVDVYAPTVDAVVTNIVTDPYSLALTTNSARSVLVDLDARSLTPKGWRQLAKPHLAQPEESSIYELHVRDFSISDDTVPSSHRGTYLAFTDRNSDGMSHLRDLASHGMNTLHLLPTNDIATIEELRSQQQTPPCDLESYGPASTEQQACVAKVAGQDGFNWGYDPLHFTTPEGSYATHPDGPARTREFRQMVQGINGAGLRVVMDVVYNHTPASGQDPKSVLDRIVPGYYQRLNPTTGAVETSTCCQNTAAEHAMMQKLMVDSLVTWATEYKVDGFRFDLMGHHPKSTVLAVRAALDRLTLRKDGVDGKAIYLYGEGWNFGEVADNARFVQASQLNMAGTGIGTFSDRLRDAVRGGGPFDEDPRMQGFGSGLYTDPNGAAVNGAPAEQLARLQHSEDLVKLGLAGNLATTRSPGRAARSSPARRSTTTASPPVRRRPERDHHLRRRARQRDALRRAAVQAADWDVDGRPGADEHSRAGHHRTGAEPVVLARRQRHLAVEVAGPELLRLRRLVQPRRLVVPGHDMGFGSAAGAGQPGKVGLPASAAFRPGTDADVVGHPDRAPAGDGSARNPVVVATLPPGHRRPDPAAAVLPGQRPGSTPGVIVMAIDDRTGRDLDRHSEGVVVVFNASDEATTQTVPSLAGTSFALHPVQADGNDPIVRTSTYSAGAFTVPARTVAVFLAR